MFGETDLLWNELQLDSLIDATEDNFPDFVHRGPTLNGISPQKNVEFLKLRDSPHKLTEVFKKPAYSALISRYQSLPHKPKSIPLKKLSLLADPIRGRYSRMSTNDSSISPKKISSNPLQKEPSSGFFLTETENSDDDLNKVKDRNDKVGQKNGFATTLRDRIDTNRKKPPQAAFNDPLLKGNRGKNKSSCKKQLFQLKLPIKKSIKKAWDTTVVNYNAKSIRNARIANSLLSANIDRKGKQLQSTNANSGLKHVPSSGYGKTELPKITSKKGEVTRDETRRSVTKKLIQGLRSQVAAPENSTIHKTKNYPRFTTVDKKDELDHSSRLLRNEHQQHSDNPLFRGLESISETLADRTRRLQRLPQRGLHASGAQSAPSQSSSTTNSSKNPISSLNHPSGNAVLPTLVSQDDQHIAHTTKTTTATNFISTNPQLPEGSEMEQDPSIAAAKALLVVKKKSRDSLAEVAEKGEKSQPEKQWMRQRQQRQENQQRLQQQEERDKKHSQATLKGTSITDLITRRIARPLPSPPSYSTTTNAIDTANTSEVGIMVLERDSITADGEENEIQKKTTNDNNDDCDDYGRLEDEEDTLRRQQLAAANERILSEVKRNLNNVKNTANIAHTVNTINNNCIGGNSDLKLPISNPTTETISTTAPSSSQNLPLSEAAQQLAYQMKKMGNHFSMAQKLSEQYKSTANEYGGLPFLE